MKRKQEEFRLTCWTADLLRKLGKPEVHWTHHPSGERRNKITGGRLKRMGSRPGCADFEFVIPPNGQAAFLELKTPKGTLTKEQREFRERVTQAGAWYAIARTEGNVAAVLQQFGVLKRPYWPPSAIVGEIIHGEGPLV